MAFVMKPGLIAQAVVMHFLGRQLDHVRFRERTPRRMRHLPKEGDTIRQFDVTEHHVSSAPVRSATYASVRLTCEDVSPSRAGRITRMADNSGSMSAVDT